MAVGRVVSGEVGESGAVVIDQRQLLAHLLQLLGNTKRQYTNTVTARRVLNEASIHYLLNRNDLATYRMHDIRRNYYIFVYKLSIEL